MESTIPKSNLLCTQCGGELHPDEGQIFLVCPFCNSTVYLDKSKVVFHWYVAPTLDEQKARSSLARWMSGSLTVKDLDKKATIKGSDFTYFPIWYFKLRSPNGDERIAIYPAAATTISEIRNLRLPAGDLRRVIPEIESQSQQPSIPLQAAAKWISENRETDLEVSEQALVHIPLHSFKYDYAGKSYAALVEAATGEVFANIYPAKPEAPYRAVGLIAALVYICLALIPVIAAISSGSQGAGIGLLVCSGLGLFIGLGLFGLAAWVAAKI